MYAISGLKKIFARQTVASRDKDQIGSIYLLKELMFVLNYHTVHLAFHLSPMHLTLSEVTLHGASALYLS